MNREIIIYINVIFTSLKDKEEKREYDILSLTYRHYWQIPTYTQGNWIYSLETITLSWIGKISYIDIISHSLKDKEEKREGGKEEEKKENTDIDSAVCFVLRYSFLFSRRSHSVELSWSSLTYTVLTQ